MQNLVSAITSDFLHRFTHNLTWSCFPPSSWMSLKMNGLDLPWPTFLGFHAPIYTIFDPVIHTTIALDEFEDEWPWPTFDLLFQIAMQNLVSTITSDFLHRFTHNLNLGWVPTWMTLTYSLPIFPNRNKWKLCQFLHVVNYMPILLTEVYPSHYYNNVKLKLKMKNYCTTCDEGIP